MEERLSKLEETQKEEQEQERNESYNEVFEDGEKSGKHNTIAVLLGFFGLTLVSWGTLSLLGELKQESWWARGDIHLLEEEVRKLQEKPKGD